MCGDHGQQKFANREEIIYTSEGRETIPRVISPGRTNRNPVTTTSRGNNESCCTTIVEQNFEYQSTFIGLYNGASEQIPNKLMNVEKLGEAQEIQPREQQRWATWYTWFASGPILHDTRAGNGKESRSYSYLGVVSKADNCFCEAATPDNASDGRVLAKTERSPGRSRAEGKCSPHTAVMTCTSLKNYFEMPAHRRGLIVGHTIAKRARQLTELRVVKSETQIQADERWDTATAAVNNLDGAAIEDILIDMEQPEVAKLDFCHLPEEGDSVALDAYIKELLHELEADEGFKFPVKELEFDVDEALVCLKSHTRR